MTRQLIEVNQEKHEQAWINRAPDEIRAEHGPHHLPNLFFHGGTPAYENAHGPKKVNSEERNSTTAYLLSGKLICKSLLCSPCGVGLRPLACWDYGFESRRRHGCLSLENVVRCETEVFARGRFLAQRIPSEVCMRVISEHQQWGGLGPSRGCCATHLTKKTFTHLTHTHTHTHTCARVSLHCKKNWSIFSCLRYLVSFAAFQNIKDLRTYSTVFR